MYTNRRKVKERISVGRHVARIATADRDERQHAHRVPSGLVFCRLCCQRALTPKNVSSYDSVASRFALGCSLHPDGTPVMIRHPSRRRAFLLSIGILFSLASTAAFADERCGQLVALNRQYAGVALTREQKDIKVQLVAWYRANCARSVRSVRHSIGAAGSGQY